MHSVRGTLGARQFLPYVEIMERMGIATAPVLAACGLSRVWLSRHPLARVDAQVEHSFWAAAERVSGDPAIGLKVGLEQARHVPRFVDVYIAFHSGTLRKLFENIERFGELADDRARVLLLEEGTLATFQCYRDGGYERAYAYMDQLFACGVPNYKQYVPGFRLARMRLRRPQPKDPAPYLEAFGVMPHFGAARDELSFDRALLDVPITGSDAQLAEILKEHASELVRKIPMIDPLLYAVQKALHDGLERGQVELSTIARATGTSARTLRRRLVALGTSFHEQLDKLRYDLATQQLGVGHTTVAQLAERLGFTSTKAFQRAFRRWTGLTPSAYRREQRSAPSPRGAQSEIAGPS